MDLSLSLTVSAISFQPGFVIPAHNPLSLSSSCHRHTCLSHSCPHLMFFLQIHHLSVVMSSFCFLPCNVARHIHIFLPPLPLRAGSMPIISSPTTFMLTSSLFTPPRCACVCLCFIRSAQSSWFDRHSAIISITPSGTRFIHRSCVHYSCVSSYHACACFHFCYRSSPAPLIFASLHTPPALPFTLHRQGSHPPTLLLPPCRPSPEGYRISSYIRSPAYHLVLIVRNRLLV